MSPRRRNRVLSTGKREFRMIDDNCLAVFKRLEGATRDSCDTCQFRLRVTYPQV